MKHRMLFTLITILLLIFCSGCGNKPFDNGLHQLVHILVPEHVGLFLLETRCTLLQLKGTQLFQQTTYHQPRQALRLGMLDISHHHDLSNIVCDEKERLDHFQPHNNLPAQSLPFVSALLLPVLHLSLALPLQHQGLGTRRLLRPYLGGFPTIFYQLTKASQNFW